MSTPETCLVCGASASVLIGSNGYGSKPAGNYWYCYDHEDSHYSCAS